MTSEPLPDDVQAAVARAGPRLGPFARRLLWYSCVTSTSDIAARLAAAGAEEGTVVSADEQTHGRGRLGRQWASPAGAGIYASVILRPAAAVAPLMTIAAGVAVSEGIESATGLRTALKWPNDLYVGPRKLAGILAEAGTTAGAFDHVIVGFGINLLSAAYPADVASRATSVESEIGRLVDRGLVLAECLAAIAARYGDLRDGRREEIVARWRRRGSVTFGRHLEWNGSQGRIEGVAEDIDERGALIVRAGGQRLAVVSGEVRWRT